MIALDEQALICDLAETYNIYDYKSLPIRTVAILASGLGENSRIRMKARDERVPMYELLLAVIADRLGGISYQLSAGKGELPPSLVEALSGQKSEKKRKKINAYSSADEFQRAWNELVAKKGGSE